MEHYPMIHVHVVWPFCYGKLVHILNEIYIYILAELNHILFCVSNT